MTEAFDCRFKQPDSKMTCPKSGLQLKELLIGRAMVTCWVPLTSSMPYALQAINGSVLATDKALRALEERQNRARFRRYRTWRYEWLVPAKAFDSWSIKINWVSGMISGKIPVCCVESRELFHRSAGRKQGRSTQEVSKRSRPELSSFPRPLQLSV